MDKSVVAGYDLFLYAICEILLNKYFNIAYQGEPVVVSRPRNENVVIISENEYRRMSLQEVHKGKVQDAFLAFDRICEEIESEAI